MDSTAGTHRIYTLPNGELEITGKFTIPSGITIQGQGWQWGDTNTYGTTLTLAADGQIELEASSTIRGVRVWMDAEASVNGITTVDEATNITIEDIMMFGGNTEVWALEINDHYEFNLRNIHIHTAANGCIFQATGPYNLGDESVNSLHVRLAAAGTTALKVLGVNEEGGVHNNNISFIDFYATAADLGASWETDANIGIDLQYVPRIVFVKPNVEEVQTALNLVGAGYITIVGGWLYNGIVAGAGCTDTIKLLNTQVTGDITGATAEYVTRL